MNPSEESLTPQDITLLRSLLGRFGGQLAQAAPPTPALPGPPTQHPPSATQPQETFTQSMPSVTILNNSIQQQSRPPSAMQPAPQFSQSVLRPSIPNNNIPQPPHSAFPLHPGHPSIAPVITPYHSALPGARGHPPPSTRISSTVENIGSGMTSQVNQQRLAASAVNLPSQLSLPQRTARRRRRGPAVSPPTLAPAFAFSINSVLSNEGSTPLFRIRVKVYPPQVSVLLC